jgi:hypothetical protein
MRLQRRLLGPTVTITAIAALLLYAVLGNTDVAILAAVLLGILLLRRYERNWPLHDNDSTPDVEISIPAVTRKQIADEGTIADLANRVRGRS